MNADNYRDLRKRLGLTQPDLAGRLGVTVRTIGRRENGRTPITAEAVFALRWLAQKPKRHAKAGDGQ